MVDVQVKDLTVLWDHRGGGDCHREGFDLRWPPGQRGTEWLKSKELSLEPRAFLVQSCVGNAGFLGEVLQGPRKAPSPGTAMTDGPYLVG